MFFNNLAKHVGYEGDVPTQTKSQPKIKKQTEEDVSPHRDSVIDPEGAGEYRVIFFNWYRNRIDTTPDQHNNEDKKLIEDGAFDKRTPK
jgi:hypothetical protein